MAFRDLPIRRKLILMLLTVNVFAVALAEFGFAAYQHSASRGKTASERTALADILAANSTAPLAAVVTQQIRELEEPGRKSDLARAEGLRRRLNAEVSVVLRRMRKMVGSDTQLLARAPGATQ